MLNRIMWKVVITGVLVGVSQLRVLNLEAQGYNCVRHSKYNTECTK